MKLLEGNSGLPAETDHVNGNGKIMSAYEMMNSNNQVQYQQQDGNNNHNDSSNNHNSAAVTVDQIHTNNVNVANECSVREQDRFMPIANVIRIMRKILPPHAKISDDAKETIQECVSEYISFITGEANERCQREQRKTITAEDVLWAMSKLGFDDYIEPLTLYLHRYRELEGDRGSSLMRSCDPLLRINRPAMPMEQCQYAAAPPPPPPYGVGHPVFHIPHPHPGYFVAPPSSSSASTVRAFFKEANSGAASNDGGQPPSASASASSVSATTFEPYAQHHD